MMKKKTLYTIIAIALFLLSSCGKTCRCYRYDGNVEEFDVAQLEKEDKTCTGLVNVDFGLTYSLCEKVMF